jgi:hypothetical protein
MSGRPDPVRAALGGPRPFAGRRCDGVVGGQKQHHVVRSPLRSYRPPSAILRGTFLTVCRVLLFVSASLYPASAETIQLEQRGGAYTIPVRINGAIILPFLIDTGSAEVVIPEDVFLTLLRSGTVSKNDFIEPGTYVLADGSEQSSDRFILHEVRVGDHIVRNVIANVAPVKGDPLLGQSFLAKLPAWTIDNTRHVLVLNDQPGSIGVLSVAELVERGWSALAAKNYAGAMHWYQLAAAQGNSEAQMKIGVLYSYGWGVPQNYAEAMRWFRMAADQGNALAQACVGQLYQNGSGVAQNYAEAMRWYRMAADQGNAAAEALVSES